MDEILDEKEKETKSTSPYKFEDGAEEFGFKSCVLIPLLMLLVFLVIILLLSFIH